MTDPALEISGLRFRHDHDGPLIVDVRSLTLARGEHLLLTGASGRGKSTLLQLIAGLLIPDEGVVRVAGREIHAMPEAGRDRFRGAHIGMIFQTFNLLQGFSAAENVMAALMFSPVPAGEHRARALALLERVGITTRDREVSRLSVGQQQRVAVARAAAVAPVLVLADEPTASLDPESSAAAMDLIQGTCREIGAALLCTSHDPAMLDRFPARTSLDDLAAAGRA
jgi:putative ABC transport system ATP-binding protein